MVRAHAATYQAFGRRERDTREPRPAHPDTLLRNHFEVEGARLTAYTPTPIVKLSTDWRTTMIRLALAGGVAGQAHAWAMGANLAVVAIAALVLWSLGRTEGKFPRVLAVMVAVGGFGYALAQRGL